MLKVICDICGNELVGNNDQSILKSIKFKMTPDGLKPREESADFCSQHTMMISLEIGRLRAEAEKNASEKDVDKTDRNKKRN